MSDRVRARVPEKQGLKPATHRAQERWEYIVRARVPEKQGLKLEARRVVEIRTACPGASSRKTRIETVDGSEPSTYTVLSGREFQKNKD